MAELLRIAGFFRDIEAVAGGGKMLAERDASTALRHLLSEIERTAATHAKELEDEVEVAATQMQAQEARGTHFPP
jgi:hypothetical protein